MNLFKKLSRGFSSLKRTFLIVRKASFLLSPRDRKVVLFISILQLALTLLDVLSIALIGVIASLSLFGIQSRELPSFLTSVINLLGLNSFTFQMQVAILGIVAGVLLVGKTLLSAIINQRIFRFLENRTARVMSDVLQKVINQPYDYLKHRSPPEILYSLTRGVSGLISGVIGSASVALGEAILLFSIFLGLFFFDPKITLVSVVYFGAISIAQSRKWNRFAEETKSASVQSLIKSETQILDSFSLYREMWVRNAIDTQVTKFFNTRSKLATHDAQLKFLPYIAKYSMESALVIGAILLMASQFLQRDALGAITVLSVFLAAATRVSPAILRLQQAVISLRLSIGESEKTLFMLDQIKPRYKLVLEECKFAEPLRAACSVELENVRFRYQDGEQDVINSISFKILSGGFYAIAGPSGNGKSTLLDLMLGALQPSSGKVLIDGIPPSLFIEQFPTGVGYVAQESNFINASIRENLQLGIPGHVSDEHLWEVLDLVGLKDVVLNLPENLDSIVGERGQSLSTGQKQRLSFSRALISNPKVLFLDEPTSALDQESELRIANLIQKLKGSVTIVMIAHRLETIKTADSIAFIENGRVTRQGKYTEIFNSD